MANEAATWVLPVLGTALLLGFAGRPETAADPSVIVDRWAEANRRDFAAAQQYSYIERIRTEEGTKTYEVTMVSGSPYKQLIEDDGKSVEDTRHVELANALEHRRREAESPDERQRRIQKYHKGRERAQRIREELPRAFDYELRATRKVDSRTLYILSATPRRGYDPPNTEASVLTGMQGEFWIDSETYQLFHGVARVLSPVSIEGFLATIQPGTEFEVDQRPVGDGIWLPTHFSIHSRSSIVHLFHHHTTEDRTFSDFRKVSVRCCSE